MTNWKKERSIFLRCFADSGPKRTDARILDNPTFDFAIGFRFERWMPISCGTFQPDLKVLVMWFHIPEAQEIVLGAITLSARSFSKERLLLRQITNSIKSKCASVTQAGLSYGEASAFSLASSRRSYGWRGFMAFRSNGYWRAGSGIRVLSCDRVTRHRLDCRLWQRS